MIKQKLKPCIQCGKDKFIFSNGRCRGCAATVKKAVRQSKSKEKKESVSSLIIELDDWFSRFIRLRDANSNGVCKCVTCGGYEEPKYIQNGHFVSRKYKSLRWHENNCHCQCFSCNVTMNGNYLEYVKFMQTKYGSERIDLMQTMKSNTCKMTRFEYQILIKQYQEKVKQLLCEKKIQKWW